MLAKPLRKMVILTAISANYAPTFGIGAYVMQFVGGVRVTDDGWLRGLVEEMPAPLDQQERAACLSRVEGAAMASDGFFPHRDSIDLAAGMGVRYVAQPGGSIRDEGVVAGCDQHGVAMAMTGLRLFHH